MRTCTKCNGGKSRKRCYLSTLPNSLCLHIKRFQLVGGGCKIDTPLQFPINGLNISKYTPLMYIIIIYSNSSLDISLYQYDLYGVVVHDGTLNGYKIIII